MLLQDRAWIAGFLDGEGCIFVAKTRKSHQLKVSASNTNRAALERLQYLVGGNIYLRKKYNITWSTAWEWVVSSQKAKELLTYVLPFLVIKKQEAYIAMEFPLWKKHKRTPPVVKILQETVSTALRKAKRGGAYQYAGM